MSAIPVVYVYHLYMNKYAIYLLNIEISPGKLEISRENFSGGKGKYQGKNLNQLTGSRLRKEHNRAACCRPVCLSYTLSTSWEMPGWMSYKLESRYVAETLTTTDM